MRNQFVGDVGDYAKYSLFPTLRTGHRSGVAWYLNPDDGSTHGGKRAYLIKPGWADLDSDVFALMQRVQDPARRSLAEVERAAFMSGVQFSGRPLADLPAKSADRPNWREEWFAATAKDLAVCQFILLDPDTGLRENDSFRPTKRDHMKYTPLSEVQHLRAGRTLMIYHHHAHLSNVTEMWMARLRPNVMAIRFAAESATRSFFIVNPTADMRIRARNWAERWPHARLVE